VSGPALFPAPIPINVPDAQQQLARAFDFSGPHSIGVYETVQPTMEVGAAAPVPLRNESLYFRGDSVSGDATHGGLVALVNPSSSRDWYVIDYVEIGAQATAQNFQLGIGWATAQAIELTFVPTVPWQQLDLRGFLPTVNNVSPNRISETAVLNLIGLGNTTIFATVRRGIDVTSLVAMGGMVLPPNTALLIGAQTVNLNWNFSIAGRIFEIRQR
jgi:hypothetical protein